MYTCRSLVNTDIRTLHHAFLEAFSDYAVPVDISLEAFGVMMKRRGFAAERSIGAFREPGQELAGFILNGVRTWRGKLTAYDLGTGIAPPDRRRGLSSRMFRMSLEGLKQIHVEQYLLEVLQDNQAAVELYQKQGFSTVRTFSCFTLNRDCRPFGKPPHSVGCVAEITESDWARLRTFWDFNPSWQNSIDSVLAAQEEFAFVLARHEGTPVGYGAVERRTGDVAQIAVCREYRRRGIGTGIAAVLRENAQNNALRAVNVDDACEGMKLFLRKLGFEQTVSQYEMLLTGV